MRGSHGGRHDRGAERLKRLMPAFEQEVRAASSTDAAAHSARYRRRPTVKKSPPSCPSVHIQPSSASQPSGRQLSAARAKKGTANSWPSVEVPSWRPYYLKARSL